MIEIIREENWDNTKEKAGLPKNIRQIGAPDIGDRIYIENQAYQRMHPIGNPVEKTVYVMLGRFEDFGGRQCTFVENVIEMEEIQFEGMLPVWNDDTWAYLYRMLGHEYDDMVIVGWAIDIRGNLPNLTAPLEKLHRTYFGGTHQVMFLMDTLEQEEAFYSLKNGCLRRREGYYIYYDKKIPERLGNAMDSLEEEKKKQESAIEAEADRDINRTAAASEQNAASGEEEPEKDLSWEFPSWRKHGREPKYRNYVQKQQEEKGLVPSYASTFLLLAVIAALGFSAFRNYEKMNEMEETLAQMNTAQTMFSGESGESSSVKVEEISGSITKDTEQPAEDSLSENIPTETTESESQESMAAQESGTAPEEVTGENQQEGADAAQSGEQDTQAEQTMTEAEAYLAQGYYIVQQGDSLVGICRKVYQTTAMMDKICEVNGIENPDAIYAGQYLTLPN